MANEAVPETRASTFHQNNSKKQPTTPLRRISRRSLSALSASRSREADDGPVLTFLEGVFAELSEAIEDLAVNFEALDAINEGLDGFNEGFAGLLYGLRMNAYTSDFIDAPTSINFQRAAVRAEQLNEAQEAERQSLDALARQQTLLSPISSSNPMAQQDATFMTSNEEDAESLQARSGSFNIRGRGSAVLKNKGLATKTQAQKKKEALIKFAQPIVATLPIQYREQQPQRADVETIIGALRQHPDGIRGMTLSERASTQECPEILRTTVPDLVKMYPLIPQHRINESLLTLVRAKHAIKMTLKGLIYRLDPLKYPPA